ncbi:MAG: hypothetical protein M1814_002570 [Vezdaea aestivalis]|nr:MAG: hypothetical protein M1814_002570 [Vezdaea aestivalis]
MFDVEISRRDELQDAWTHIARPRASTVGGLVQLLYHAMFLSGAERSRFAGCQGLLSTCRIVGGEASIALYKRIIFTFILDYQLIELDSKARIETIRTSDISDQIIHALYLPKNPPWGLLCPGTWQRVRSLNITILLNENPDVHLINADPESYTVLRNIEKRAIKLAEESLIQLVDIIKKFNEQFLDLFRIQIKNWGWSASILTSQMLRDKKALIMARESALFPLAQLKGLRSVKFGNSDDKSTVMRLDFAQALSASMTAPPGSAQGSLEQYRYDFNPQSNNLDGQFDGFADWYVDERMPSGRIASCFQVARPDFC